MLGFSFPAYKAHSPLACCFISRRDSESVLDQLVSNCKVLWIPLGLIKGSFWLRRSGNPAFLSGVQVMPGLLLPGPGIQYPYLMLSVGLGGEEGHSDGGPMTSIDGIAWALTRILRFPQTCRTRVYLLGSQVRVCHFKSEQCG